MHGPWGFQFITGTTNEPLAVHPYSERPTTYYNVKINIILRVCV